MTDLRRSWSRARLNPAPSHPREVEVFIPEVDPEAEAPDWSPVESPPIGVIGSPTEEPEIIEEVFAVASPPKARPKHISDIISLVRQPTPPRLRVGVDWRNTLQFEDPRKGVPSHIPPENLDSLRRLARYHEVYILSFAPSRNRSADVELECEEFGVFDISGSHRRLYTGRQIPAKVSGVDHFGVYKDGKAKIAKALGIHVLIDDSRDIGDEARRIGLNFIGINSWWALRRGEVHHFGVKNFVEAVDLIMEDPNRWY